MAQYVSCLDFYVKPNFSVTKQDIINTPCEDGLGTPLISSLEPGLRSLIAKKRYSKFIDTNIDSPLIYQILAEASFWLEDIKVCYIYLQKLANLIGPDEQLEHIMEMVNDIIINSEYDEELFFHNKGEDKIEDAILFEFRSPYKCPNISPLPIYNSLKDLASSISMEEYQRYACVTSNILEYVFEITDESLKLLVKIGFQESSVIYPSDNKEEIVRICNNTLSALNMINHFEQFDEQLIKDIHKTLLGQDNFDKITMYDYNNQEYTSYRVIPAGKFRNNACITIRNDDTEVIQYCHYKNIDTEMAKYCERVRELLESDIDPFIKSAWIHWAFVRIHPFADGNGRVARILASIPLIRMNLPPIIVTIDNKDEYLEALHVADIRKDLTDLAAFTSGSMGNAIRKLQIGF